MNLQIDVSELKKSFKLVNGVLWRFARKNQFDKPEWRPVDAKPKKVNEYSQVRWNGKLFLYHRLVYVLSTFHDIPENMQIDHIDGDPTNNRIENLRVVTNRENQQNRKKHRDGSLVGCYWDKNAQKWSAKIYFKGQRKHLGLFSTEQEAHEAYLEVLSKIN
jgi:hypothetical protein